MGQGQSSQPKNYTRMEWYLKRPTYAFDRIVHKKKPVQPPKAVPTESKSSLPTITLSEMFRPVQGGAIPTITLSEMFRPVQGGAIPTTTVSKMFREQEERAEEVKGGAYPTPPVASLIHSVPVSSNKTAEFRRDLMDFVNSLEVVEPPSNVSIVSSADCSVCQKRNVSGGSVSSGSLSSLSSLSDVSRVSSTVGLMKEELQKEFKVSKEPLCGSPEKKEEKPKSPSSLCVNTPSVVTGGEKKEECAAPSVVSGGQTSVHIEVKKESPEPTPSVSAIHTPSGGSTERKGDDSIAAYLETRQQRFLKNFQKTESKALQEESVIH